MVLLMTAESRQVHVMPSPAIKTERSSRPVADPAPPPAEPARWSPPGALLDDDALLASRRLLSRLIAAPEAATEGSLEALTLELLRPLLSERLNDYLPQVVNRVVAQELARLSAAGDQPSGAEPLGKPRPA